MAPVESIFLRILLIRYSKYFYIIDVMLPFLSTVLSVLEDKESCVLNKLYVSV